MDHNRELDPIEHILASEEELVPSSGLVATVMEQIHEESTIPPPLPFPWKRAILGILLVAGVFGWGAFLMLRWALSSARGILLTTPHLPAAAGDAIVSTGWTVMALAVSLLTWLLSRRLTGRTGLL